ncbi:MAG: hypothetical protein M4D85_11850 [Actinomycetota bacterium]|nr:hypothetical protein [Actinomycetota bacterium]
MPIVSTTYSDWFRLAGYPDSGVRRITRSADVFLTLKRETRRMEVRERDTPTREHLTPAEDRDLRVLHWLASFGAELSPARASLVAELRERDLRATVREPDQAVQLWS